MTDRKRRLWCAEGQMTSLTGVLTAFLAFQNEKSRSRDEHATQHQKRYTPSSKHRRKHTERPSMSARGDWAAGTIRCHGFVRVLQVVLA